MINKIMKLVNSQEKPNYTLLAILSFLYIFIFMIGLDPIKILFDKPNFNIIIIYIFVIILIIPITFIFIKGYNFIFKLSNIKLKNVRTGKYNVLKMIGLLIAFNLVEGFFNINNINSEILQMAARSILITIVLLIIIRHYETKDDSTK